MSAKQTVAKVIRPKTFHFQDPDENCPAWSNGQHIVTASENYGYGLCRCGKKFAIIEVE